MTFSSYSNYLEYKNCKRDTIPCNNNFNTYKKYNRSLNCGRAWWTNPVLKRQVLSSPCKMWPSPMYETVSFDPTISPVDKGNCSSLKQCTQN